MAGEEGTGDATEYPPAGSTGMESGPGYGDGEHGPGGDETPTAIARAELRTTFEYQVQRLREIDGKAIELLKANLLLIGLVVTAGSILVQTDLDVAPFVNAFTVTGGFLLLVSTALAGVTYTSSNLRGGMDPDAVDAAITASASTGEGDVDDRAGVEATDALTGEATDTLASEATDALAGEATDTLAGESFENRLLRSYSRWIDYNARVIAVNDMLATATVLLVVVAFVYVIAGIAIGALGPTLVVRAAAYLVLTVVLWWFFRLVYNMDHLGPKDPRWAGTFEGIPLSKGASRERGFSALRAMVGRSPREDDED